MNISINDTLKRLRTARGSTQEDLAAHCGVSMQAVSKWERGERYPDITLLPKIAAFYGVTVDELLGVGEIRKQEKIAEYDARARPHNNRGEIEQVLDVYREAYAEFPNDFGVIQNYMYALDKFDEKYRDEVIALGERILRECTDSEPRYSAIQILTYVHSAMGDREKAKEYAMMAPKSAISSNGLLEAVLTGDELLGRTQLNLMLELDDIDLTVTWMLRSREFTPDEIIAAREKVLHIFEIVYDDGDFGFYHTRISGIYISLARQYARLKNREKVIECAALAQKHEKIYHEAPSHTLNALLVRGSVYETGNTITNNTKHDWSVTFLNEALFDFVRGDPEFIALLG
ncbi:MAG: helix-turn-helix transcriptional regulator [Oscillospiraceae bacterium]|nr:helix-turn-helix transcriptional regulator [Oscillospiraceae bacterium]